MNAKRKGARNEHRSIVMLESAGYACTRAAASMGVFDVIGIGPTDVVLVQCKTREWPGSVEMEAIRRFQCPPLWRLVIQTNLTEERGGGITVTNGFHSVGVAAFATTTEPEVVPEPSSLALLGTGLLPVIGVIRRRYLNR